MTARLIASLLAATAAILPAGAPAQEREGRRAEAREQRQAARERGERFARPQQAGRAERTFRQDGGQRRIRDEADAGPALDQRPDRARLQRDAPAGRRDNDRARGERVGYQGERGTVERGDGRRDRDRRILRDEGVRRDWQRADNDRRDWNRGSYAYQDRRNWNRGWRQDRRYDWNRYRGANRHAFRLPRYYAPSGWGYGYRRFGIGVTLSQVLFAQNYWIDDPWSYRLPDAYGPYRWIRYYNDALLVDLRTGRVIDVVDGIFWY